MSTQHDSVIRQPYPLKTRVLQVIRTEDIAPDMRRIHLSGDDLEQTLAVEYFAPADHVKLALQHPETGEISLPTFSEKGIHRPDDAILREYTIRSFDPGTMELAIDFVLHDHGPAGRWAIEAQPGDKIGVIGPGDP